MRVPSVIVLLYLPFTASQCVDVLHDDKQCIPGKAAFKSTETVLGCLELCMTQSTHNCTYVQWNIKTKDCILLRRRRHLSTIGDCITIKKNICDLVYDSVCFEPSSDNVFKGNKELTGLTQEEDCKTLCMFMVTCRAYTWFVRTSRCRIHRRTILSGEKLEKGDKQARKKMLCSASRCVVLRASVFSSNGHKEEALTSIGQCMKSGLNTTAVGIVDWSFYDDTCWSHKDRYSTAITHHDIQVIQLLKAGFCKLTRRSMCMKKRKHVGMSNGYKIANVYEEDCVSLCYVVANCAAVELDGNGVDCVFHVFRKEIKQMTGHTLYVAHDCSVDHTESTSPTTTVTSADGRRNADGIFRWPYSTRFSAQIVKAIRRTCLKCGLLCPNCTGLSCEDNINGEGCNVNIKDIRTRICRELKLIKSVSD